MLHQRPLRPLPRFAICRGLVCHRRTIHLAGNASSSSDILAGRCRVPLMLESLCNSRDFVLINAHFRWFALLFYAQNPSGRQQTDVIPPGSRMPSVRFRHGRLPPDRVGALRRCPRHCPASAAGWWFLRYDPPCSSSVVTRNGTNPETGKQGVVVSESDAVVNVLWKAMSDLNCRLHRQTIWGLKPWMRKAMPGPTKCQAHPGIVIPSSHF